jgi:hypothetical protein
MDALIGEVAMDEACRGGIDASSAFSRSANSVGTPARLPLFTSAFFTHSSSVCPEQPIMAAMDVIAAQRDGCSPS